MPPRAISGDSSHFRPENDNLLNRQHKTQHRAIMNAENIQQSPAALTVVGIDPGNNGGIAAVSGGRLLMAAKMPATPMDLLQLLGQFSPESTVCYLEKVQGLPGMGGGAMFSFGRGYGHLEMALLALRLPCVTATPQKWQKHYQLGSMTSVGKTEWKNKLKAKAQQLFPSAKVTLAIADALLIAKYGADSEKGTQR